MTKQKNKINNSNWFDVVNAIFLVLVAFLTISPFLFILASSFSDIHPIIRNEVIFIPKEFTLEGYRTVLRDGQIFQAYYNTLWYTIVGTIINLVCTLPPAFVLSRRSYRARNGIMFFISFTMFFSGGMVPSFLLINYLGLYNTRWVMVIPGAISAYNLIMARTFFTGNAPDEIYESAKIDGANDLEIFLRIVLPISTPIIAVLALYYGVGHWNSFYNAMVYLREPEYTPLSLYLRRLLILGTTNYSSTELTGSLVEMDHIAVMGHTQRMKYCSIIVTMLPILFIYPFFQKYFTKGVMVGAIKA